VTIHQWGPLSSAPQEQYLHRIARPDQPELNSLQTHLQMAGYNLVGVGTLSASRAGLQQLSSEFVLANTAQFGELQADHISANEVVTPWGDIEAMLERIEAYDLLWQECRAGGGCQ
jgi:hypothetical protein